MTIIVVQTSKILCLGSVIFAEKGKEKIYSINPSDKELNLVVNSGVDGIINSLEFDDFGNNIYWVNPADYTVNVHSLNTQATMIIQKGDSACIPLSVTLAPSKGLA